MALNQIDGEKVAIRAFGKCTPAPTPDAAGISRRLDPLATVSVSTDGVVNAKLLPPVQSEG